MPVNEGGKIASGECGLLVRDRVECQARINNDLRPIALGDGAVLFDPFCLQPAPANTRGSGADLVLRFQRNALRF